MAKKMVLKRIKITKTGKLLHRKAGLNHFNAKAARKVQLRGKGTVAFPQAIDQRVKTYLYRL